MISTYTYKDLTWIDLESPTRDEVRLIMEQYGIHPLVGNELLTPTEHPKVDLYDNMVYLVLHFPAISHKHSAETKQEIDFIIGEKFLITTHYDLIDPLHEFSKVFEVNTILDKSSMGTHAGFIFFFIIRELYKNLTQQLDGIAESLKKIESEIFSGHEGKKMVEVISRVNRDLLNFKQSIRSHKQVFESFELAGAKLFGNDFLYYLRSLTGEYHKVAAILDGHKDTLLDLRDTNDSLLTTKTNSVMQYLTVITFLILPSTLLATIFNMEVTEMPKLTFWSVVVTMILSMVIMYIFFKRKKWI
jgi:magnesium transporter